MEINLETNEILKVVVDGTCEFNICGERNSSTIENFLMGLQNRKSIGIPIGPYPSHLFSEVSLMDIDDFIYNHNNNYTRYVDDIRIFSNDKNIIVFHYLI